MIRRLLTPGWLVLHVVALAGVVALLGLGRWQWRRGEELHHLVNYSYGVEWWLFAAFAVFLWVKTMADALDDARGAAPEAAPEPVRLPPPVTAADEAEDPELAAYNRRLAELHARDQGQP